MVSLPYDYIVLNHLIQTVLNQLMFTNQCLLLSHAKSIRLVTALTIYSYTLADYRAKDG